MGRLSRGMVAGAVGTTALEAVGYLDLGVTNPRRWSSQDWAADVLPHLAYGVITATTYRMLSRGA